MLSITVLGSKQINAIFEIFCKCHYRSLLKELLAWESFLLVEQKLSTLLCNDGVGYHSLKTFYCENHIDLFSSNVIMPIVWF